MRSHGIHGWVLAGSVAVLCVAAAAQEKEDRTLLTHEQMNAIIGAGRAGGAAAGPALPQHMNAEFNILLGKTLSAVEIRDFLSGEFEPVPLSEVMAVLRAREAAGAIRLTPR